MLESGWPRNRTGTGNRDRQNKFPKPKAEPEPPEPFSRNRNRNRSFLLNFTETQKTFLQRNRQNRKPEQIEPFHSQTVTEPNRTGASLWNEGWSNPISSVHFSRAPALNGLPGEAFFLSLKIFVTALGRFRMWLDFSLEALIQAHRPALNRPFLSGLFFRGFSKRENGSLIGAGEGGHLRKGSFRWRNL